MMRKTCGVLTISDKGARGERRDTSGPALTRILAGQGFDIKIFTIVPDDIEKIREVLLNWADQLQLALIVTTGGTGVSPSDLTPEATREVLDREVPGIAEAMRFSSMAKTPYAMLSRGVTGIRAQSLIINLPGSEQGAVDNLLAIINTLPHALKKIQGCQEDCGNASQAFTCPTPSSDKQQTKITPKTIA